MVSPYSRALPQRADLAQQKRQARELLGAFARGEPEATARVRFVLPDKVRIVLADTQFVLAREYGFENWSALKRQIDERTAAARGPHEQMHMAMQQHDAVTVRRLLSEHAAFRPLINAPLFPFNSPAIVACASSDAMVEVLLEFGADPNQRSGWWAGGFHALHSATGAAAARLLAAGAVPDACAAAHLDDHALLATMLAADPSRAHERGGDGQTPLHFARSRAVIDLLLDHGADIDARDLDHRATAAEWMLERHRDVGRYDLAGYLVKRGATADIFLAAALGLSERAEALLRERPALLGELTGRGRYGEQPPSSSHIYFWSIGANRSPLDVAAQFGQGETLRVMLPFATPAQRLRLACSTADAAQARALVRQYPDLVASLDAGDHRAISDAAWNGNVSAVELMLELGFDPGTPGHDSGTALHCAAWQGSASTVTAILATPAGRALLTVRDAHYSSSPLGWCCHGSVNGPRGGEHPAVARALLEAGAPLEMLESSEEVEHVLSEFTIARQ
jgi:ankyrin repeat protein